jgi:hypothetical protein
MQGLGGGSPRYYVYKDFGLPTYMMTIRTIDIPENSFESEKTFIFTPFGFHCNRIFSNRNQSLLLDNFR